MTRTRLRIALLFAGITVLAAPTAANVLGGPPRDASGVPLRPDARDEAIRDAAGGPVLGTCILQGEAWTAFPPTEGEIVAALARGEGAAVDDTYSLGPVDTLAKARGLEIRWSDGNVVYAIDPTAKLPTVLGLSRMMVGSHELWSITYQSAVGGCDGDQVPAAPVP